MRCNDARDDGAQALRLVLPSRIAQMRRLWRSGCRAGYRPTHHGREAMMPRCAARISPSFVLRSLRRACRV